MCAAKKTGRNRIGSLRDMLSTQEGCALQLTVLNSVRMQVDTLGKADTHVPNVRDQFLTDKRQPLNRQRRLNSGLTLEGLFKTRSLDLFPTRTL